MRRYRNGCSILRCSRKALDEPHRKGSVQSGRGVFPPISWGAHKTVARPKGTEIKLNPEQIEKFAQIGATQKEMAWLLGISTGTLESRLQRPIYRAALERGQGNLAMSLKRKQVEMALAGDRTMLVWLGKNYLGQSDKLDTKLTGSGPGGELQLDVSADELLRTELSRIAARSSSGRSS